MTDSLPTFDGVEPLETSTNYATSPSHRLHDELDRLTELVRCDRLDDEVRATFRVEAEAVVEELRKRARADMGGEDVATDGGEPVSDDDTPTLDDHETAMLELEDDESTTKCVHTAATRTVVEDGDVVHKVTVDAEPANGATGFYGFSECPACEADVDRVDDCTAEYMSGDVRKRVYACTADECAFEATLATADSTLKSEGYGRDDAVYALATVPAVDPADVFDDGVDAITDDDGETMWGLYRTLMTGKVRSKLYDDDVVDANPDDEDDYSKTLAAVECGVCGDEVRESTAETHAHFGDVCAEHADETVFDREGVELRGDVEDALERHKSVSRDALVKLLRDVLYYPNFVATKRDDGKEPSGVKTGRGGKRDAHGLGRGKPGTGLRRPSGAFHNRTHWRTLLGDAVETGLIERVDDADELDDENENAVWSATEKGRDVFEALARCETCGESLKPYKRVSTYTVGRRTKKDTTLTLACAECDEMSHSPSGMTIRDSSGSFSLQTLDGVEYE